MSKQKNKKTRKKVRLSGLIVVLLVLYIICMGVYYIFITPVKNIYIKGNELVSEKEIINKINIKDTTPIVKVHSSRIKNKLESLDMINEVTVKKGIFGKITITVKENKVLYYDILSSKYTLTDGTKIESDDFFGYPTLVNYVPKKIEKSLIKGLTKIDEDIILMISEIEYSPSTYNNVTVDDKRFILRMNDGNTVYINVVNIEKLNKYQEIYKSISSGGTLYLDSNSKNYIFKGYSEEEEIPEDTDEEKEDAEDES